MKKVYVRPERYLLNLNSPDGGAGAGGSVGAEGGEATPPVSQTPPASAESATPPVAANWRDSIPAELVNDPRFKDVESVSDLIKSYAAVKPAAEVPEKYVLPKGVPEEVGAWGKETGLTQEQFDTVLKKYGAVESGRLTTVKTANQNGFKELMKSWGEEAKPNLALANRVIEFADPKGELKLAEFLKGPRSNFASISPMIITMFHNIGKAMEEGGALKGSKVPGNTTGKKVHYSHEIYPDQAPK